MFKTAALARLLGGKVIFALNQAARIMPRGYVTQSNVARQGAKKRNPVPNEDRHASDDKALNEPRAQESLNRDSAVYVDVAGTAGSKLRQNVSRRSSHLFHNSASCGQIDVVTAQHHHSLVGIGPLFHTQNRFERLAANDNRVDSRYELVVAVGFAAARR